MKNREINGVKYGPWLVDRGAALWGTESAWRIPLNGLFDAEVIVFWEHVLILFLSGFAGSAVGTIFFTLALKNGNPTVVNVILNIQPGISTIGAYLLFRDQLAPRFYFFAAIAILAGIFLSVDHSELIGVSFEKAGLNRGTGFALICALFWGLSTVAGRGVMTGMSLRLASSLRIVGRVILHDADHTFCRQDEWRFTLAGGRPGKSAHGDWRAGSSRNDLRWNPAPDLL